MTGRKATVLQTMGNFKNSKEERKEGFLKKTQYD